MVYQPSPAERLRLGENGEFSNDIGLYLKPGAMGLHFWLLEDLGGKAASCEEASSIKLLQVKMKMVANKIMTTTFSR